MHTGGWLGELLAAFMQQHHRPSSALITSHGYYSKIQSLMRVVAHQTASLSGTTTGHGCCTLFHPCCNSGPGCCTLLHNHKAVCCTTSGLAVVLSSSTMGLAVAPSSIPATTSGLAVAPSSTAMEATVEVVVVGRINNLCTGNLEWGGNEKGLRKGRSVYEQPGTRVDGACHSKEGSK
jgi:hypothetical protein